MCFPLPSTLPLRLIKIGGPGLACHWHCGGGSQRGSPCQCGPLRLAPPGRFFEVLVRWQLRWGQPAARRLRSPHAPWAPPAGPPPPRAAQWQ